MIRPTLSAIVLGGLVLVPLAACSTTPEAEPTAISVTTDPSPSPSEDEADPCDLLTADAAEALAGEPMTDSRVADIGGLPACQMQGDTRGIQVAQVPAAVWAESVPGIIDQIQSAGELDEENQARVNEVAKQLAAGQFDALAACELFSTMAEFGGVAPGQSRTVAYVPDGQAPQGLSAQSCVDGTYNSVLLVGNEIVVSDKATAAIEATLDVLEGR